jgi:hypothetical protein
MRNIPSIATVPHLTLRATAAAAIAACAMAAAPQVMAQASKRQPTTTRSSRSTT